MNEQIAAKKRALLKRYLRKLGINKTHCYDLVRLQKMVRAIHRQVRRLELIRSHHYLRNLFAMKRMSGMKAKLGFAFEGDCLTIADLVKIRCAPRHLEGLYDHFGKLLTFDRWHFNVRDGRAAA